MEDVEIPIIKKDILNEIPSEEILDKINNLLQESKRPVIIAGNGIKIYQ